ncbi:MAG TPA: hypothetical protein VLC95_06665 [Anaerolineae bacterium]|nr:hypothetical protein [Anaerolineae bacterium]
MTYTIHNYSYTEPVIVVSGITVGGDSEMVPRERLTGVPFAATAGYATLAEEANWLRSLHTYTFRRINTDLIYYKGPSGIEETLDLSQCGAEGWCCDTGQNICYFHQAGVDSILEFSLAGASSYACTLLHDEDDIPNTSKGLYFATDGGNQCYMAKPCARLSKDGVEGPAVPMAHVTYHWLCFDIAASQATANAER